MPDSEKPADNGGKKPFNKRRRFRKNRGERTEQQQNSQTSQDQSSGQDQQSGRSQRSSQPSGQDQQSGRSQRSSQPSGQDQQSGRSQRSSQPSGQDQQSGRSQRSSQPSGQDQQSGRSQRSSQPSGQDQQSGRSQRSSQPSGQDQQSGRSQRSSQPSGQDQQSGRSQRSSQPSGQDQQSGRSQRSSQPSGQDQQSGRSQRSSQPSGQGQQSGQRPRFQDKSNGRHKDSRNRVREKAPSWDAEESLRATPLPDTKEELRQILEAVNPEELMMTPLFQKRKYTNPTPESSEETLMPDDLLLEGSPRVTVDVVNSCPICDNPIREVMYALHDYEHNRLAHFDCVFKKVSDSLQDKLIDQRHLAYLGSGAFGIMEPVPNKPNRERLVEKIYPGAPVEELLRAGENQPDEEL